MKKYITAEQAINIIPEKEYIHTFYSIGVLIGADWERIEIIKKNKVKRYIRTYRRNSTENRTWPSYL